MIDGIAAILSDEAATRRAKRQNKHRSYDLLLPYDPILDGVDLNEIFKAVSCRSGKLLTVKKE